MMARNGGSLERRVVFLEKVYLEDRKRWSRAERVMMGTLQALRRQGERLDLFVRMWRRKSEE